MAPSCAPRRPAAAWPPSRRDVPRRARSHREGQHQRRVRRRRDVRRLRHRIPAVLAGCFLILRDREREARPHLLPGLGHRARAIGGLGGDDPQGQLAAGLLEAEHAVDLLGDPPAGRRGQRRAARHRHRRVSGELTHGRRRGGRRRRVGRSRRGHRRRGRGRRRRLRRATARGEEGEQERGGAAPRHARGSREESVHHDRRDLWRCVRGASASVTPVMERRAATRRGFLRRTSRDCDVARPSHAPPPHATGRSARPLGLASLDRSVAAP